MRAPSTAQRIGAVLLATLLLVLSGTMAWAAVYDYGERGSVPKGVNVVGVDLSGMTEQEARTAIERAVATPLMRPLTVVADGKEYTFDPRGSVRIDVDGMLGQAYAPRRTAAFVARVRHDVGLTPLEASIAPLYSVDETAVASWLDSVADQIDKPAVDATLTVSESAVAIKASTDGRKTDLSEGARVIASAFASDKALSDTERTVMVPVEILKPKVTADSFGKTIVVDLSQRRVRLFNGAKLEKAYPCAIGTPSYPTPTGHFEIELKRYLPTWVNPAPNGWGKDMPKSIPPGPGNPLGTRAINLSAPGIRFHGTSNTGSIGTAASHGCMRMYRSDIEDLFERVEVGMQVYIVP